jgi:hypothetical protein
MRPFQFLFDLPWWTGLPIFLAGTALVTHAYPIGVTVALFGIWTFYKLMEPESFKDPYFAMVGFPLFFLAMLIPIRFSFETPVLDLLNELGKTTTYAIRSALGLATALFAFRSFR